MKRRFKTPALAVAVAVAALPLLVACDDGAGDGETADEIASVVAPGKADDFYSVSAQEYYVEGSTTITLDAEWASASVAEREAEIRRLIPYKQVVIGWFLNVYVVDKHDATNEEYGGFKALTKNGSYEDMELTQVDELTWSFSFRQEVGGQLDLIKSIPDARPRGDGTWDFDLAIGVIDNETMQELDTDGEWYRRSPWSSFDPSAVSDERKEILPLVIRPEPGSTDGWMEHDRLFEDGKLTVGIHFGWDYHKAYHEVHSRQVYDWLVAKGFESPVASYDELEHDSGPLTGVTEYDGREIAVEVSIFWGKTGSATDPDTAAGGRQLEADMLESLDSREVVVFNGHSGPFYGFALANWRKTSEGDLDDSELAEVPLNTGVYQLILAEGCDTYALGQAFYDNPYKDGLEDLDIITTTSFSNASTSATVTDVLGALIGPRYSKDSSPKTYSALMRDLDSNSYWFTTMYGVHGIDDAPTVHPFADPALTCAACDRDRDCGEGMRCVGMEDGTRACGAICTASTGCGAGFDCRHTQSSGWLRDMVCVPQTLSCERPVAEPTVVLINEVMPNPADDYNGDGEQSRVHDEFIELVNASAKPVDLAGWSLSDGVGVRHVFATGTELPPGGAIIVFGGGAPTIVPGTTVVQTASTGRLALNNGGDSVRLVDLDGQTVGSARYPDGLDAGTSLNRDKDGDATDSWRYVPASPGTKADGSHF
ncbi:MAG: hypothetical protein CSA66_04375 [Proteobacteria bacterium]|nr:MAG: hypothetical protein CSA66_04375 [Pseudomonadota bacterium]